MVGMITLEICKINGESRYISYFHEDGSLFIRIGVGYEGEYAEDNIQLYSCPNSPYYKVFFKYIEKLKIYSWPKVIPEDYVPGKYMIGCDVDSWSLVYREVGKKRTRHIHGEFASLEKEPYLTLVRLLDAASPKKWIRWLDE